MQYYQCEKYPIEFVVSENIDKHFETHNHVSHYVISMIARGAVTLYMENRETVCRRGDVFIVPPYTAHSVRQGKDARLLSVCIGTALIEAGDIETVERIVRVFLGDVVKPGIFGKGQKEKMLTFVRMLYGLREKGQKSMDADVRFLADKITAHPEQELSIETLAADIFVSKYHLIRKFKKGTGMTPHRFCIQNRIRRSQRLLDAEKTVGEISAEMGFYDQSHFNRAFRRIVGVSPSEYIRSKKQIAQGT
ncbi:MAG: AraC family transcriptional regulator [Bacteroidales bacterium]|nr:AraC family transcriptional regulator [Bacteroidales bacterium]MCM1415228.1 AraC family transcriptional regulator [bacterium]MCM1423778.1 AraC family transcriptional regulator [bacterium]